MHEERPEDAPTWPATAVEAWRAAAQESLKGGDFERRLVSQSLEGHRIEPLYHAGHALPPQPAPGVFPFTRGATAHTAWQAAAEIDGPSIAAGAEQIREALAGGVAALQLVVHSAQRPGLQLQQPADLAPLIKEVSAAHALSLDGGARTADFAAALWPLRRADAGHAEDNLGLDPLGQWLSLPEAPADLVGSFESALTIAAAASEGGYTGQLFLLDGAALQGAGASLGQTLGYLLANGVQILRGLVTQGLDVAPAARRIAYSLDLDGQLFANLSALRAFRQTWAQIVADSLAAERGQAEPDAEVFAATPPAFLQVRPARHLWAIRHVHSNLLRATAASFAGIVGGAQRILSPAFDTRLGQSDRDARRIARNLPHVLRLEGQLGQVQDPAGGAWFIERRTQQLAQFAWQSFQAIEAAGGLLAAVQQPSFAQDLLKTAEVQQRAVARRRQPIVGLSRYPLLSEAPVERAAWPEFATGEAPVHGAASGKPAHIPLPRVQLGAGFEALRDASDAQWALTGARPQVAIVALGSEASHSARLSFAREWLAAGGVEGVLLQAAEIDAGSAQVAQNTAKSGAGSAQDSAHSAEDGAPWVQAFARSGLKVAMICGSDALYSEQAGAVGQALRRAGAQVWIAGKPQPEWAEAAEDFIALGQDALAQLQRLWTQLGAGEGAQ